MQKFDAIVVGGGPGTTSAPPWEPARGTALVGGGGGHLPEPGVHPLPRRCSLIRGYLSRRQNGAPFGVSADNVTFDYAKIIERKNAVSSS